MENSFSTDTLLRVTPTMANDDRDHRETSWKHMSTTQNHAGSGAHLLLVASLNLFQMCVQHVVTAVMQVLFRTTKANRW